MAAVLLYLLFYRLDLGILLCVGQEAALGKPGFLKRPAASHIRKRRRCDPGGGPAPAAVPGSDGVVETVEEARAFAEKAGYPVLVKASAGGGGKGMREVHDPEDLEAQFLAAKNEAQAAFGNGDVYLEKLVLRPRHVEVQV